MTLDEASDRFEQKPSPEAAEDYVFTATRYYIDMMIRGKELLSIIEATFPYRKE